ncbi:hypothetical protein [Pseudomonas sp. LS-2]|jgi:hypothetical protein|uniref:hypothetical protein n=1 Tax=Pseudomonas sp. LS-2 TaxID=2315859 RepID=UPI001058F110|nr:hypothetical protein [Pseudomonas sp. LS-2]
MNRSTISRALLVAVVTFGSGLTMSSPAVAAGDVGSALPPGVNPSSPAGGNGGDAQGYEKKPANPPPPGSMEKSTPPKSSPQTPTTHKQTTQKKSQHKESVQPQKTPSQ